MPELPEVETVVRNLRQCGLAGLAVTGARVTWARTIACPTAAEFSRRLKGLTIRQIQRRGKFIHITLSGGHALLIHLRMTGRLQFADAEETRDTHDHVVLDLSDGRRLRFHDTRKFGRWWLLDDPAPVLGALGPEPLDRRFTPREFARRVRAHRRLLKPLLLDQSFVAGIGNIYADEALWESRIDPRRRSDTLSPEEAHALHRALQTVLRRGIRALGTTLGRGENNFYGVAGRQGRNQTALRVFRRTGQDCPRCGAAIQRIIVAQRSTHVCPQCQRRPS